MKARYVLWPVMIFGAVSLASACSSDSSNGGGDTTLGGSDGEGGSGVHTGATTSTGATDSNGGMSTTDAGAPNGGVVTGGGAATGGAAEGGATGGGLCEGKDLDCPDDDNPCTEDDCNPDTGECGIPRSGTACDDGKYCNGDDTCDAGECTVHEGTPCSGTCNEAGDYCECATKADCPADEVSDWTECAYATACVETAMRSRSLAKYTCNGVGKCEKGAATVESEACTRETDGLSCDDGLRCTGTDKCKNGNCDHTGNPCAGGAADADGCWEKGTMCRACGVGASCASRYFCCDNDGTTASCKFGVCGIIANISIDPTP